MRVSHRSTPFPGSHGKFRAWLVKPPVNFWLGLAENVKRPAASTRTSTKKKTDPDVAPPHEDKEKEEDEEGEDDDVSDYEDKDGAGMEEGEGG